MVTQAGALLDDDGIMIVGTNGLAIQSRYFVYENKGGNLIAGEFAFSLDNLGPISFMPWFSLHDNDPESMRLARLSAQLRSDETFWPEFSHTVDRLLEENEICWRGANGFYQVPREEMPAEKYMPKIISMWQEIDKKGYVDGAVEVLKKAGYDAWKNVIGDISVRPLNEPG